LTLHGRDSKIAVTDYDLGGDKLLYSSAEIFTWKQYGSKKVLVVYGGPNETHELAISHAGHAKLVEGDGVKITHQRGNVILNFETSPKRRVVEVNNHIYVYVLGK